MKEEPAMRPTKNSLKEYENMCDNSPIQGGTFISTIFQVFSELLERIEALERTNNMVCRMELQQWVRLQPRDRVPKKLHEFADDIGCKLVEHTSCGQDVWKVEDK